MINPQKGIDLMNNTSIIIRILFVVTLFQQLVGFMGELDLSRSIALTITLRDRVMEVELLRGQHTVGPPLDPIYPHSWITSHSATMRMKLRTTLSSMSGSITP